MAVPGMSSTIDTSEALDLSSLATKGVLGLEYYQRGIVDDRMKELVGGGLELCERLARGLKAYGADGTRAISVSEVESYAIVSSLVSPEAPARLEAKQVSQMVREAKRLLKSIVDSEERVEPPEIEKYQVFLNQIGASYLRVAATGVSEDENTQGVHYI